MYDEDDDDEFEYEYDDGVHDCVAEHDYLYDGDTAEEDDAGCVKGDDEYCVCVAVVCYGDACGAVCDCDDGSEADVVAADDDVTAYGVEDGCGGAADW